MSLCVLAAQPPVRPLQVRATPVQQVAGEDMCSHIRQHQATNSRAFSSPLRLLPSLCGVCRLLLLCSLPPTLLAAVLPFDGSCEEFEPPELEEAKGLAFLEG